MGAYLPAVAADSNADANSTDIVIRIKNGVAVLTGQAGSREEKRAAAMAASRVAGVDQVYDLMLLEA